MSEAGCPAVADPGAGLVRLAHARGHVVEPLIGPSSLLLALMASGANGQRFAFSWLSAGGRGRTRRRLAQAGAKSRERDCAQLFIETPYRNQQMLSVLRHTLKPHTLLTAACDLTLPTQTIISRTVRDWPTPGPDLHKRPAIFVLCGEVKTSAPISIGDVGHGRRVSANLPPTPARHPLVPGQVPPGSHIDKPCRAEQLTHGRRLLPAVFHQQPAAGAGGQGRRRSVGGCSSGRRQSRSTPAGSKRRSPCCRWGSSAAI